MRREEEHDMTRTRIAARVLIIVALASGCTDLPRPRAVPDDPSMHHPDGLDERLHQAWERSLARGMFWPDTATARTYVEAGHASRVAWVMLSRTGAGPCDSTYTRTFLDGRRAMC
jgi:hypothetical protein